MSEDKQTLGRSVPRAERDMVMNLANALTRSSLAGAAGAAPDVDNESAIEEAAVFEGAGLLFDFKDEGFISALAILLIPKELKAKSRRIAAVAQPFGFVCNISRKERLAVLTPPGYVTDFASIPKFAHGFISPFGKHAEAAVVHDWLYTLGDKGDRRGRRLADRAFVKALRLLEVGFITRMIMYFAVRLGGGAGYGLPGDFAFRRLDDLQVVDPPPPREPFRRTFAIQTLDKKAMRDKSVAKAPRTS